MQLPFLRLRRGSHVGELYDGCGEKNQKSVEITDSPARQEIVLRMSCQRQTLPNRLRSNSGRLANTGKQLPCSSGWWQFIDLWIICSLNPVRYIRILTFEPL